MPHFERPILETILQATMRTINFIAWKQAQSQEKYIKARGSTPKGIVQKCSKKE